MKLLNQPAFFPPPLFEFLFVLILVFGVFLALCVFVLVAEVGFSRVVRFGGYVESGLNKLR